MRQLGATLGVEAMSIYHYVNGREDLLELVVEAVIADVHISPQEILGPADGWQTFLQHVGHAVREIAVRHPRLFPLVATRPPEAPWLRPPLRSLRLVEDFLQGLIGRGLSDQNAVYVYKVFTGFLLGHLLLEVAQRGAGTAPEEVPFNEGDADVPTRDEQREVSVHPTVDRLSEELSRHDPEAEFERAMEMLLDRFDGDLSE